MTFTTMAMKIIANEVNNAALASLKRVLSRAASILNK